MIFGINIEKILNKVLYNIMLIVLKNLELDRINLNIINVIDDIYIVNVILNEEKLKVWN